jgi:hypothetical protein
MKGEGPSRVTLSASLEGSGAMSSRQPTVLLKTLFLPRSFTGLSTRLE